MSTFSPRNTLFAAALAVVFAGSASAQQGPKPEDEIRYRQSVMNVQGRAMGPMGAMAQGKAPFNAAVAQKNSALLDSLMGLAWNSFGPGTDKGAPTRADAKIWSDAAGFKRAAEDAQKAVAQLAAVAKDGDETKFKSAFGAVGKACKGCHDDYRTKEMRN
jgi:cytochrome c556